MQVEEGLGWRLVVDCSRQPFPVLIGGATWAVELTAEEAEALASGVLLLRTQHAQIADQLMDQEDLDLDWERDQLWIGLSMSQGLWSLRFVLEGRGGRRSVEGSWDGAASPALALALEGLPARLAGGVAVSDQGRSRAADDPDRPL